VTNQLDFGGNPDHDQGFPDSDRGQDPGIFKGFFI